MAKFIFKMQSLLNIKLKLEEQAKAEYGIEQMKLNEEERKLEVLNSRKDGYQKQLKQTMSAQLNVMEIKRLENSIENIKYNIKIQITVIKAQQLRVEKARRKLDECMKERKTYEKLKEKAFEVFKQEINKQEQKEIDELVSYRFGVKAGRED